MIDPFESPPYDPYDPTHPDGPTDIDDLPAPLVGSSWLEDDSDQGSTWSWSTEDPE